MNNYNFTFNLNSRYYLPKEDPVFIESSLSSSLESYDNQTIHEKLWSNLSDHSIQKSKNIANRLGGLDRVTDLIYQSNVIHQFFLDKGKIHFDRFDNYLDESSLEHYPIIMENNPEHLIYLIKEELNGHNFVFKVRFNIGFIESTAVIELTNLSDLDKDIALKNNSINRISSLFKILSDKGCFSFIPVGKSEFSYSWRGPALWETSDEEEAIKLLDKSHLILQDVNNMKDMIRNATRC